MCTSNGWCMLTIPYRTFNMIDQYDGISLIHRSLPFTSPISQAITQCASSTAPMLHSYFSPQVSARLLPPRMVSLVDAKKQPPHQHHLQPEKTRVGGVRVEKKATEESRVVVRGDGQNYRFISKLKKS